MRILWVKAGKILPVDTGGKIRSWNLIKALAARHQLTMLSYYSGDPDPEYERALEAALPGSIAMCTHVPESGLLARAWHFAARVPNPAPYAVTKFTDGKVRERVKALLDPAHTDVAICDFLAASLNFPAKSAVPVVLFQHNVESALWTRQAAHEPNVVLRAVYALEAAKMKRYEARTVQRFDHVLAVSEHDKTLMSAWTDPTRISVVPTGVDVSTYSRAASMPAATTPTVIFLGSMDWEANIDGVTWFTEKCWPAVRAAVPGARFRIVGRNPHARVQRLAAPDIEITGTVPNVVDYLADAWAVVVPLRVGGGTRLKIYEAMAAARATVSTTIGAEGLDVTNGRDIVIADEPDHFARATIDLLKDSLLRARIAHGAAATASRYGWPAIADGLTRTLERLMPAARQSLRPGVPTVGTVVEA